MGGGRGIVYGSDPRWEFWNRQPVWSCLAGVSRRFDGFGRRGGRYALYILAAEHGRMEPWQGWYGMGGIAGGGAIGSPLSGQLSM